MYPLFYALLLSPLLNIVFIILLSLSRYLILNSRRPKPCDESTEEPRKNPVSISLRFQNIPNKFDELSFRYAVGSGERGGIVGLSWTKSAITESTCTATACFAVKPPFLDDISTNPGFDIGISLKSNFGTVEVSVDNHFIGMTPLYWPKSHPDVDIVAVTGWNGKPFWSWKPENSPYMWLRDWLGQDLARNGCSARIFTYGYPAPVANSTSNASFHDYGKAFLGYLVSIRRLQYEALQTRPLILIGHSLGGILIKHALKEAYASENDAEKSILESCVGLFMFGVPNLGLENRALVTMTEGHKNESFARELGADSHYLPELERNFSHAFRGRKIKAFSIFETLDSPSVEKKNGRWTREGPLVRMVTKFSACSLGVHSEPIAAFSNHSNLVKFADKSNGTYQTVLSKIIDMIKLVYASRKVNVPSLLSANFVGRREVIQHIKTSFASGTRDCSVFVLVGSGGMGKTQIALEYIKSHLEPIKRVLWIQSDSEASMQGSFSSIAGILGIQEFDHGDDAALVQQVLTRISAARQETILVYDSLDSTELISKVGSQHLPKWRYSGSIKVLVTSRNRECLKLGPLVRHVDIDPLERKEAIALLSTSISGIQTPGTEEDSSIESICDDLGCLPLGIQQAASLMKVTGILPQQYLTQFREQPRHTLAYTMDWSGNTQQRSNVLTVWEGNLQQIEMMHPLSTKLFHLCGFLGTEVPYSLFQMAYDFLKTSPTRYRRLNQIRSQVGWIFEPNGFPGPWTTSRLQLSTLPLQNLSMAKTTSCGHGGVSLAIHALVQQWLRMRLPTEKSKDFISTAASLIYLCAQSLQTRHRAPADTRTTFLHQRHLLMHVYSCIEFSSQHLGVNIAEIIPLECSDQFAMFLVHNRDYASAEEMLLTSLRIDEESGGRDAEAKISAFRTLSLTLRRQKKISEALLAQEAALNMMHDPASRDRLIGQTPRAEGELATIYRDLNRLEEAYMLQSSAVEKTRDHFGHGSLETLHEMACLAVLIKRGDDYKRALQIEEEVFRLYNEHFPDRIEKWDAMKRLAITYYYLDRNDEAIELELQVVDAKTRLYGRDHLETAAAAHNLATTYKDSGNHLEAIHYYSEALKIRQAVLGHSDEKTRKTATVLAETTSVLYTRADSGIGMELETSPRTQSRTLSQIGVW